MKVYVLVKSLRKLKSSSSLEEKAIEHYAPLVDGYCESNNAEQAYELS